MDYDEYDASVLVQYGNDMVNTVAYDEVHRRPVYRQLGNDYSYPLQQIYYDYDGVGNIVHLSQNAPPYNNYGGEYQVSYIYDEQYRLWDAWQNNSALGDYSYTMHYSPSGLVGTKVCPELDADIVFGYDYDGEMPLTHQPKMIHSPSYYEDMTLLSWNANGELKSVVQPYQDRFRRHWWNEAGQLSAAIGNEYCGYYGYNAQGERAYKLTGTVTTDQYNAGEVGINTYFDDIVLYVNPYMVVTPRGYTKHYYNGSQRIAARIGGYWHDESVFVSSPALTNTAESLWAATLYKEELREQETPFDEVYVSPVGGFWPVPQYGPVVANLSGMHADDLLSSVFSGHNSEQLDYDTVGIYFYHSDHLGSANWITNSQGEAVQYIHYMPFGELWADQQFYAYDERYKFTGKERDTETGYDYFGARYYASALPMWLSVDPLADKYPGLNPYAYCVWNPMKYVDPDGKEITINGEDGVTVTYVPKGEDKGNDNFTKQMWSDLDAILATKSGEIVVNKLSNDRDDALNIPKQAKRYAAELPYSQRPRWIVTCNFRSWCIYDMEQPNSEPQVVLSLSIHFLLTNTKPPLWN